MTILFYGPDGLCAAEISYVSYDSELNYLWMLVNDANLALKELQFDMNQEKADEVIKTLFVEKKFDFTTFGRARLSD